jgi:hypothetical protein
VIFLVGDTDHVEGRGGKEEESFRQELRVCRKGTSSSRPRKIKKRKRVSDSACEPGIDRGLPIDFWLR